MAKAILGHMGGADPRVQAQLISENRRLRQQVSDLEALVFRLQAENEALLADGSGLLDDLKQLA